jgi:Tfp pilus assembly protein PilN
MPRRQPPDPLLPTVNFLSPWVFEAIATRRLRRQFVAAGCALILIIGAGWAMQALRVNQAEQVLTVAQAEGAGLGSQTRALAPVRAYVAAVENQKRTVQTAMANEVYVSRILEGLRATAPAGVTVQTAAVIVAAPATVAGASAQTGTAVTAAASDCPGPDPFATRMASGCITLSGSADSRAAVGDFVIRLGRSALFVEPFISTTTATTTAAAAGTSEANAAIETVTKTAASVAFTGSVRISPLVLSRRYADLDRLLASGGNR